MHETSSPLEHLDRSSKPPSACNAPQLPVIIAGLSLSLFFAVTFVLCVLFDMWFPAFAMNTVWAPLLPGFTWISWPSFLLGLVESFAYGWYVALVFGHLFNFFATKMDSTARL